MLVFNLLFSTSQSLVIYLYTYIPLPRSDLKPMFQKEISPPIDCWKLLPKLFVIFHMYSPASSTWSPKCPKPQYYRELFYDGQMLWARLYTVWSSVFSGTLWLLSIWWSRWHSLPLITVQLRNQFLTKKKLSHEPTDQMAGAKGCHLSSTQTLFFDCQKRHISLFREVCLCNWSYWPENYN